MGDKLNYFKFQSLQNPFGILFHPLAIENLISKAVKKEKYSEEDVFHLNEQWHCYDAHSDLSDASKEKLLDQLNFSLQETSNQISKASHIFITLGSAWVYRVVKSKKVVANCHKVPQKEFSKVLLSIDAIQKSLESIIEVIHSQNQKAEIIFTVSPVRHLKDGFVENRRSKAHLIASIHQFTETSHFKPRISYFESYEIMIDELRDYRFYKADMVHPNEIAIDYIWNKFAKGWISPKSLPTIEKVDAIQKGLQHRPFNPNSEKHQAFIKSLEKKIEEIQGEYSFIKF